MKDTDEVGCSVTATDFVLSPFVHLLSYRKVTTMIEMLMVQCGTLLRLHCVDGDENG